MLKLPQFSVALVMSALLSAPALAAPPASKNFVTVNGVAVPQNVADAFASEQLARGYPDSPDFRENIKNELVRRALLVGEARKKGLDKQPQVKDQVEIATQLILIRAVVADFVKNNPVTDAEIQQGYDEFSARMGSAEYKASHILVATEDEAKAIIEKLGQGVAFAELAKESTDPGSKDNGGDLGWSVPSAYTPAFGEALKTLEKGKYTTVPVQTEFGYHVIFLEDTRDLTPPSLDEIKPQLAQQIAQLKVGKMIQNLLSTAKIKFN